MKNLLFILFVALSSMTFAQKAGKLMVKYSFTNIQEGYDHDTKTEIYVDGELVGESKQHKESKPATIVASVPQGSHEVKIVNYTYYQGKWEIRSIENDYSTEGTIVKTVMIKKKKLITIVFDLNNPDPEYIEK
jgi:hypothetical protein